MKRDVLLLNSSEEVLGVIDWKKAINLLQSGKATKPYNFEHYYPIQASNGTYVLPSAIVLVKYVRIPHSEIQLSKKNILRRDNYTCQYCGKRQLAKLEIDHVHPRSKGGKNSWTNLVACCHTCNVKKGNRNLNETSMKLLSTPFKPKGDFIKITVLDGNLQKIWERWLVYK